MKFPRVLKRLLLGYVILHLVVTAVVGLLVTRVVRSKLTQAAEARMGAVSMVLAEQLDRLEGEVNDETLAGILERLDNGAETDLRLTVIDADGNVVADTGSESEDLGDQAARQENLLAAQNGVGFVQRPSQATGKPMLYYSRAYRSVSTGGFVRVATSGDSIESVIGQLHNYIWVFALIAGALAVWPMVALSRRSTQAIAKFSETAQKIGDGEYENADSVLSRDGSWDELREAFRQMESKLARREERLMENSQRLEAVLSSMIEGVLAIQASGEVMLANGAACQMLDLTRPELVGRKLLEIVRIPELRVAVEKTQLQRRFSDTEFKTLDNPQRILSARVSILAGNRKSGVAIVLHDVTELRQLETMRQDFVANVSHELKTPLAAIKAYAETLRLGAIHDSEKNVVFIQEIESSAEMLNSQIQDLLQLARVESGEKAFEISNVSINDVCSSCHRQFSKVAQDHNVQLQLNLSDDAPQIAADEEAVKTIVKNLVVNAIHYTPSGGSVRIETDVDQQSAIITVADTGIGISADQQTRVFERFYRVDKARSRDMGGTGLGLSIVKHLTQSFGGAVLLESQLGKGSKFRVRLPLAN